MKIFGQGVFRLGLVFQQTGLALLYLCNTAFLAFGAEKAPMTLACTAAQNQQACIRQQNRIFQAPTGDGRLTISNNTGSTVYKLFAWPTYLNPRTFNILNSPLIAGANIEVFVDNIYGDCDFSFQYDANDPAKVRKKTYHIKSLKDLEANICDGKNFVWIGPVPTGKSQGYP